MENKRLSFKKENVTAARIVRNFELNALAGLYKIDLGRLKGIEAGDTEPTLKEVLLLCRAFDVTPNFFFGLSSFSELDS